MTQAAMAVTRIPLVSACPKCGHEQAQWYSHLADLHRPGYVPRSRPSTAVD
jgi:hypothetical protein